MVLRSMYSSKAPTASCTVLWARSGGSNTGASAWEGCSARTTSGCGFNSVKTAMRCTWSAAVIGLSTVTYLFDGAIDHHVRDVDVQRSEFPGHALCQGTNAMLGSGECSKTCGAAQAGSGPGKQNRAALAGDHALGHFAGIEKPRETGHLPDLEIFARGFFEDAAGDVGANVEHHGFDRADLGFDLFDQSDDLFLLARIAGKAVGFAAAGADRVHQRLKLVGAAPRYAGDQSFTGETLGNRTSGGITCTDNQYDFLVVSSFSHCHRSLVNGR